MALSDPVGTETRSELADWVELSSIVAASGSSGAAELRRLLSREQEDSHEPIVEPETGEALEEETLESVASEIEDAIVQELQFRVGLLGESYPFELIVERNVWRVAYRGSEGQGRRTYLACLFISAMRDRRLQETSLREKSGVDPARLFQAISASAAVAYFGDGISFGWPRPDGTPFIDALKVFTDRLGVGVPKTVPPLASPRREKDEGIDVIAWRSFTDRRPGHLVLFGQVASGGNWRGKPVAADMRGFFDWFHTWPTWHPVEGMFIPFPQHHDCAPLKGVDWDTAVIDFCRRNEIDFGLIFDRLRLTELAQETDVSDIDAWVSGAIATAASADV